MAASRESSQYSRHRSNTAQSLYRPAPTSLANGDTKVLHAWVHDVKDSHSVVFNQAWWPGVQEGDCLRVLSSNADDPETAFLFIVPKYEPCPKPQLQISVPRPIAEVFGLRNNNEVTMTKVNKESWCADYVEFIFQDQYLGRNDMWRLGKYLSGQCIYRDQEISFIGGIVAKIRNIYIDGKKVSSALMTSATKAIYRSFSAKITIFIQVCRELWEFAGDGERYNEKVVHSFLPALFQKWREANTNHTVTIVLISRVFYDESEIDYAAGPLLRDERGNWYKDFFKVITDLQVINEWKPTLVSLKNSFWDFQRDILLTHHYHRAAQDSGPDAQPQEVRLVGKLSYAQDGPVLEAMNLGLNPTETHYIDRSLNVTGSSTLLISPGTGYFRVSKKLLRLTTTRMLDQGFVLDLVLLTKPPLHQSPIFSFEGVDPMAKPEKDGEYKEPKFESDRTTMYPLTSDPLWVGDDDPTIDARKKKTFWWEPFWISTTFWDRQMDLPFRQDRFLARAKMHEIQMLGLLEHDVLSSIEVPYIENSSPPSDTGSHQGGSDACISKADADKFDLETFGLSFNFDTFTLPKAMENKVPAPQRPITEKRTSHRHSIIGAGRIDTIEESPRIPGQNDLPSETLLVVEKAPPPTIQRSASPSQSVRSETRSEKSTSSRGVSRAPSLSSKGTLASKLGAPAWLFNPFRSQPSEPQTTQVSASGSASTEADKMKSQKSLAKAALPSSPIRMPGPKSLMGSSHSSIQPVAIKATATVQRSNLSRTLEDETLIPLRSSFIRRSPINTPPRDDHMASKRRSGASSLGHSFLSSSPITLVNPTRPQGKVLYSQASLARRWQHIYPRPHYKHDLKWKSIVTPGCLPLTVEHFPSSAELESAYDVFSYEFIIDPGEMRSFLVKPPFVQGTSADEHRRAWALVVMRGMAAVRLAQGFQFILKPPKSRTDEDRPGNAFRRTKSFTADEELDSWPKGAAEVLTTTTDPVYLSMTNEIHRISYTGEAIQVRRYVRRTPQSSPFQYKCLIWPKLGEGYTELTTEFKSHGLEDYGWNRLDMLVAGYEHHFNESLRYWRTRFVVIPTAEHPHVTIGPSGEKLNDEEARILGIEKLAEQFTKLRWTSPDEKSVHAPVRFLPTTLDPVLSVLDESLMDQLDQIHAQGPLRKKIRSEREIADMPLSAIAKAMREEDGVPIAAYHWHHSHYPDSFIGYDFVSWLVREFRDVSTRTQATEWGLRLEEQGLFEHCRRHHKFLDGHYYYRLKGEYSLHTTPKTNWFRRYAEDGTAMRNAYQSLAPVKASVKTAPAVRKAKKRLILSQTMVIDIDPHKRSDQAESVILHHDIIHNPATVFHFELHWIGTTPRCIEDQLRTWSRTIERYGLKLVEAYVTQICDIRDRNPFQSCYPMTLALAPPTIPDLEKRIPEGSLAVKYFEYALLHKFGFILDVEATDLYPDQVDVIYSYRRSPYKYSQFVHRTGVAFIQVVGGEKGFLFLTNRLMGPGRMGSAMKAKNHLPAATAEEIRVVMAAFCMDKEKLQKFYAEQVALLPPAPYAAEEPPPLQI